MLFVTIIVAAVDHLDFAGVFAAGTDVVDFSDVNIILAGFVNILLLT